MSVILMPSNPGTITEIDPDFKKEWDDINRVGHRVSLFDHDLFVSENVFISNISYPKSTNKYNAVLRGWMLSKEEYTSLYERLKKANITLINTPDQYLNTHYFPNVYPIIEKFSPKAVWFKDISDKSIIENRRKLEETHIKDVIIKDFVKSEKGSDIFILKKDLSDEEFVKRVHQFIESRGKLFNEGIVFKELVPLKKYGRSESTNEWRIFVNRGQVLQYVCNSPELAKSYRTNNFIKWSVIDRVKMGIDSNFYTIDVAESENGEMVILETGDGQVSGLAEGQDIIRFYKNLYI